MSTSNPFSASGVQLALSGIGVAQTLVQLYANELILQPSTQLASVPSFPADQRAAVDAAQTVLNEGLPLLLGASADARGFANQFGAMSRQLAELAAILDDPGTATAAWRAAAATMTSGVELLCNKAAGARRDADDGQADLTTLHSALQTVAVAIVADQQVAQQVLGEGEIKELRSQLATIQNAIDADNTTLARGATDGALASVKVALAVVQAYYEGPADGAQTLVGAIGGIVQSGQEQQAAMTDVTKQMAAYQQVFTQLAVDEVALAIVTSEAINVELLVAHAQEGVLAMQTARDAWAALVTKLGNLRQVLAGPPTAALGLTAAIADATTGWSSVLALVDRIQGLAALPVSKGAA